VVPVVMMVEGVHNGSHGPLLHRIDDLGRFPASWDGIPITIDHPQENGVSISANSPGVIEREAVGRVYGTHVEGAKLKAEAWLDIERLRELRPEVLTYIQEKNPLDVSVGVFTDEEEETGFWNGEKYEAVAINHRPDHLALLPGGVGAKSSKKEVLLQDEVRREVSYIALSGDGDAKKNENESVTLKSYEKMQRKKEPCKIDELIAHKGTRFVEEDREWLSKQPDEVLDKLFPVDNVVSEGKKKVEDIKPEEAMKVLKATFKKEEDFLRAIPDKYAESFRTGLKLLEERRAMLIKSILENTEDTWTKEELESESTEKLMKLHRSIKRDAEMQDYSAAVGNNTSSTVPEVEPLYPTGVKVGQENKK